MTGCMIEAFKHCRPVLCVDRTFLTKMYKGQLLSIGVDANDKVVPIAFAFVESKNAESWLWFFSLIKQAVVCESYPIHRKQTARQKDMFHNANLRRIRKKGYGCLGVIYICFSCNVQIIL